MDFLYCDKKFPSPANLFSKYFTFLTYQFHKINKFPFLKNLQNNGQV